LVVNPEKRFAGLGNKVSIEEDPNQAVCAECLTSGTAFDYQLRAIVMLKSFNNRLSVVVTAWLLLFYLHTICSVYAQAVSLELQTIPPEIINERLRRLHPQNADREAELKMMFEEARCKAVEEQVVVRKAPPNITCTLLGTTDSLIMVGAHFDHADLGAGALDDWSGASLLPSLFQALNDQPRKHTFVFVGFTDEEKGLVGSNFYVAHFPKDRLSAIKAVVNLECLGLSPTKVWAHVASPELLDDLVKITRSMHADLQGVDVDRVGNDDTQAFRDKKIPVITIHSMTQETWPILHSTKDNLTAIRPDDLYNSYRVTAEYLAFIDKVLN
jgi:Peptidase family M28